MVYSHWVTDPTSLNAPCAQLLKKGDNNLGELETFYWAHGYGYEANCNLDTDNRYICEKSPNVSLPMKIK